MSVNGTISGPGFDPEPSPEPGIEDDRPLRIGPGGIEPTDFVREETDEDREAGARLARRLLVAFILVGAIWVVFVTILSSWIPPMVPILVSLVIMVGAIMAGAEDVNRPVAQDDDGPQGCDDGCAVGMCGGPRPLGEMSRRARDRRG